MLTILSLDILCRARIPSRADRREAMNRDLVVAVPPMSARIVTRFDLYSGIII